MNRHSWLLPAAALSVFLTTISLAQVFEQQRWLLPGIVAIVVAFGTGWVARRLDVPAVLSPALSLLALVTLLGITFHPGTTTLGVPTAATMHAIGESLSQAWRDIRELAAPAQPTDALTLLATSGVFLIATIVDLEVFRLRRPVAAGLPLLALYLVPTAMTTHANVFVFVLGAAGFLTLLVAEGRDRARAWGRRLSGVEHADEVADLSHVARVGRRIGSAAVGLALCVPLVVPSVGKGFFAEAGSGPFGRGSGSRTVTVANPIVEIRRRLQDPETRVLITVKTSSPEYLRLTPLEEFNGAEWRFVQHRVGSDHRVGKKKTIPRPSAFAEVVTTEGDYEISVGNFSSQWLPLPYAPSVVDVDGDWRYEDSGYSVFSTEKSTKGLTYTAVSRLPQVSADQMQEPGGTPRSMLPYLKVPDPTPPAVVTKVLNQVTGKLTTPYEKARALNEYFFSKGGFTYDLNVAPGWNTDALTAFLTSKRGYCEQFAGTMAYLARLASIPARVVVGFTPGRLNSSGVYVITNHDAHAWPELWFPHAGWVRFEPTPRAGTDVPGYARTVTTPGDQVPPPGSSGSSRSPTPPPTPSSAARQRDEANPNDPDNPLAQTRKRAALPYLPVGLAVAAAVVLTPSVVGFVTRRRRRARASDHLGRIHAAWETLADAAEDAGYGLRAADSPRAAARRLVTLASLTGPAAGEVARLAQAEERARYARSAPPVDGLEASVRVVRKAMRASLPRVERARSVVFPASSLRRISDGTRRAAAAVDRTRARARGWLRGLVRRGRTRAA